ncbi:MAG: rod shape-determining protein MreD [Candidatus Jidaibacter sp.]|jgi:rod shape-determining protein MreD|nr:rod shape-determining protein MreD [Candidatus Jidaibacter sp.]
MLIAKMDLSYKTDIKLYFLLLFLVYVPYAFFNLFSISIRPEILLITIFYFSIIKLFNVSLVYLALIGLLNDELLNTALGLHAIIYVTITVLGRTNANSLYKQKFSVVFCSFILFVLISEVLRQIINFSLNLPVSISYSQIFGIVVTILLYPVMHYFYTIKITWFINKNAR